MHQRSTLILVVAAAACALLALAAYWPGLHGSFLFDDFANLPVLGSSGPIDSWPALWRYITSGVNDPFGRPLTLLTFLLDAHNWPADPLPFKRTSLILHLLNGALLALLLARLGRALYSDPRPTTAAPACGLEPPYGDPSRDEALRRRINLAALLGAALWLLHPLLVSTTFYIVQREAMLPATCILAGLLAWLHGRQLLRSGRLGRGLLWVCVGLGGGTLLAVLAKANGALLPLYALAIECTVLTRRPLVAGSIKRVYGATMGVLAVVPSLAIVGYVLWIGVRGIASGAMGIRSWAIGQRLLTEPRVLWDYLSLLWLPRPFSHGSFNDQILASTSLWRPATTLPALLGVFLLIAGAWWLRRRHPALALAVLFYFAGQLIESTSLPLELYFEHRNYVPALLMFWPLALWLADTRKLALPKMILMVALPLGLAVMTHARAEVWGHPETQALLWAQINPHSPRAQANAAQIEIDAGQPRAALRRLRPLLAAEPAQAQLAFNWIDARCALGDVTPADLAMTRQAMLTTANPGTLLTSWFGRKLPQVAAGECRGLTLGDMLGLADAGLENPRLTGGGRQQDLWSVRAHIALLQHQPDTALAAFTKALDWDPRPGMALAAAATLGAAGDPARGLQLLDHYAQGRQHAPSPGIGMPMLHAWVLVHQDYWPHEIAHLRRQLELDAAAKQADTVHRLPQTSTVH